VTARWQGWLALAGAVVVLGAVWGAGYQRGAAETYRVRTDTLRVTIARLDTVYRRDTLVFWRTKRIVDTLVRVDSIPVIARDSARADTALRVTLSAVSACAVALETCERRVSAERQLRVAAESALAVRGAPSRRSPALAFSVGALAGLLSALLLTR
jgi:hypothetical protein